MEIKTLRDYIEFTRTTVVYEKALELPYLYLGLLGEMFEAQEADMLNVKKEFSDVIYYGIRLLDALGYTADDIMILIDKLEYDEDTVISGYFKSANLIKKILRADGNDNSKVIASQLMPFIIGMLTKGIEDEGYNLEDLIEVSTKKLSERMAKGTIKGDGDNR